MSIYMALFYSGLPRRIICAVSISYVAGSSNHKIDLSQHHIASLT